MILGSIDVLTCNDDGFITPLLLLLPPLLLGLAALVGFFFCPFGAILNLLMLDQLEGIED